MKKSNIIIVSLIVILVLTIVFLIIRMNTTSTSSLTCNKDANNVKELIVFRYDVNNHLYSYKKDIKLYNLDTNTLNQKFDEYNEQYDKYKDQLNDNFKYDINKYDNNMTVSIYIGVSVYPSFYNQFIGEEKLNTDRSMDDIKVYLEKNEYNCTIRK